MLRGHVFKYVKCYRRQINVGKNQNSGGLLGVEVRLIDKGHEESFRDDGNIFCSEGASATRVYAFVKNQMTFKICAFYCL